MRWLLGLLVLAALGGVGWIVLGHGESRVDAPAEASPDPRTEARPADVAVTLEGAGGEGPRGARAPAGTSALLCRVVRDGKPTMAQVEVRFAAAAILPTGEQWWQRWQRDLFTPPAPPGAPGPALATATSDGQGHARVEGLGLGIYRVSARAGDGARADANAYLSTRGAQVVVLLELKAADQAFGGKVLWADGRAVAGTLVVTPPTNRGSGGLPTTVTLGQVAVALAPDGSFQLGGLTSGVHGVKVLLAGGTQANGPNAVLPLTSPYLLVLDAPALRVAGRVLEGAGESPVAGALVVSAGPMGPTSSWGSTRTAAGEDGRFELLVARVPVTLYAVAPGFGVAQRQVPAAGSELTIRLVRVARIAGRVTTKDGQPAVGAVVAAAAGSRNQGRVTAVADRDGHYALEEVPAGEALVVVRGGGWMSPDFGDARDSGFNPFAVSVPGGASLTLDLVAVPAGRIEGRVLDASGAPVGGAGLGAQAASAAGGGQVYWRLQQVLGGESAASDASGAFVLENLVPGFSYQLTATAPDQPQTTAGPFTAWADAPTVAEVRFAAARYVDVRVLFEGDDAPVADAQVSLVTVQGPDSWSGLAGQWTTDREGRAHVGPVGPGELGVNVSGESVVQRPKPVVVEGSKASPGPFALTLHLPRGRTIEGRVLMPDGTPAAGLWVYANATGTGLNRGTNADADGAFVIKGLGGGTHNLGASLQQPSKPVLSVNAQAEAGATGVRLTLVESPVAASEALVVKVLDDHGEPVRQVQTRLTSLNRNWGNNANEGSVRYELSKSNNAWVLEGLAQGTLFLEVWGARGWNDQPLAVAPVRLGPLGSQQREIEVRLPPERSIEGRVTADDGAPVRGVLVRARPSNNPDGPSQSTSEGRSDEQGRFRVGGIADGEHTLEVAPPPDFLPPQVPPVAAGTKDLEIRLRRGLSARIRVRDADGQPLAGAWVSAQMRQPEDLTPQQQGEWWQRSNRWGQQSGATTAQDGTARLRGMDPEVQWNLVVGSNREDLRGTSQERWRPADTEVRLELGYVLSGVVRDPQGRALPGAQVMRKHSEGNWSGIGVGPDGTWRIGGLERGPVTLMALAPGASVQDWNDPGLPSVTVAAGTEDVVLTADPGLELVVRVTNVADHEAEGRPAQAALFVQRGEAWEQRGWANDQGGRFTFKGLRADERCTLWIAPAQGHEFYGLATDLRAGAGEVPLALQRGGTIQGRVRMASGTYDSLSVGAGNTMSCWIQGVVDADGRFEIKGVPPGAWKVQAWAQVGKQQANASVDASAGSTVELRLELPPAR